MTLSEMMIELREHPHANGVVPKRQPVCLLLGGGMAAGKSTVREIIGQDIFWSKVCRPKKARPDRAAAMSGCLITGHALQEPLR